MKKCKKCNKEKEDLKFEKHIDKNGYECARKICRNCVNQKRRQQNTTDRQHHLSYKYGMTIVEYELMLKLQNGVCAICKRPETVKRNNKIRPLSVDHNPATSKIRGLLCNKCNVGLGRFNDNLEILKQAVKYLERK